MSTVMVVDDSDDLREIVAMILTDAGHHVVEAENGQVALDLLRSGIEPGLILLDLMMPVLSGPELLALLREDARLAALPVVVISAFDGGAEQGVSRFVRKPVSAATLRDLVVQYAAS
jgi:CheY-like chemotaxis protein